jgi:hypothetical protein
MSHSTEALSGKNYAIMRVERIGTLAEMRRIEQHNTREKLSENVEPDGPPPRELLPDAHADTVIGARERMVELQLDLGKVAGAVGVEMFLGTSPAWWYTASEQMKQGWIDANVSYLRDKFGRALLSAKLHEDEKTPHIHAVALAAVSKVDGVRGPKPKTDEGWARRRAEEAKRKSRWRWCYRDLFGQDFEQLSLEQDRYHTAVEHLGLARGERKREVTDVVMDNGRVVPAAKVSRGKRRDGSDRPRRRITTKQYQAETRNDRALAAEELRQATQDREAASAIRAAADADRRVAAEARKDAELSTQQAETERLAAAAIRADAERERLIQQAVISRERSELANLIAAAEEDRAAATRLRQDIEIAQTSAKQASEAAAADAAEAERARHEAETVRRAAHAERDAAASARREADERHALRTAQLELLARAADDENGLQLSPRNSSFTLRKSHLSDADRIVYERPWSSSLIAVARALAFALERLRSLALRLAKREQVVDEREAAAEARERQIMQDRSDFETERAAHSAAIADLELRRRAANEVEARAAERLALAESRVAAADRRHHDADARLARHDRWVRAMDALEANPAWLEIDAKGGLRLHPVTARVSPPELVATLQEPAPRWAVALAAKRLDVAEARGRADECERQAAYATDRLEEMIASVGSVLTSEQKAVVTEAKRIVQQFGNARDDHQR